MGTWVRLGRGCDSLGGSVRLPVAASVTAPPRSAASGTSPSMRGTLISTVTVPWACSWRTTLNADAYTISRAAIASQARMANTTPSEPYSADAELTARGT